VIDCDSLRTSSRLVDEVQELELLLVGRSKLRDKFLEYCLREQHMDNVNFLITFIEVQKYWQVSCPYMSAMHTEFAPATEPHVRV
jgi:hypothetical protein